ncbi:MAG TPA: DegT/DnrJ/EryC1/StrS family aminotransferase [Candidatus Saccharimonadales bacterium]|nr:DegT/DnrJ/EryC1/StrS family aminotransferase [Candidatus Saccharimonadales bacterium]
MTVPILDLKAQYSTIKQEVRAAIDAVLEKQHFILGPEVKALEKEIADYCGTKYAVGVASGTDALILGLAACGVGPGDEVIVPSFSFIATADAVSALGAKPVFAEIERGTFNISPASVEPLITARTKALAPVHLYGQCADMDPLLALAKSHNLKVVEDTAQAIGSTYKGRRAAAMGDVGCISFFPSKNLGGYGDGGMAVTNSEEVFQRLLSLRSHGSIKKYFSVEQGWNSRLDELQAAILRVKLRHLDQWNGQRRAAADHYDRLLQECVPEAQVPARSGLGDHVFHQYTIRVEARDLVQKRLEEMGVTTMVYYPTPIHRQPIYAALGYQEGSLPVTEAACRQAVSLPMFPEITEEQVEYVCVSLRQAVKG